MNAITNTGDEMTSQTKTVAHGIKLVGLALALTVALFAEETVAQELTLHEDAHSVFGSGPSLGGHGGFATSCAVSVFCQPIPGLLPDYGWSTSTGGLRVLCLISMAADAALVFKGRLDERNGKGSASSLELFERNGLLAQMNLSPALTTIKSGDATVGLALGLNGTF
jgi:hypothetical protein